MTSNVEVYYLINVPHGRAWVWMDCELLVIEATLDQAARQAAIDEAFADARARAVATAGAA